MQRILIVLSRVFIFLGYRDGVFDDTPRDEGVVRLRYRSNGTCRPFAIRVARDENDRMDLSIDLLGSARIVEAVEL